MTFKRLFLLTLFIIPTTANALDKDLGVSKRFKAHMYEEMGNKVCNAYSPPLIQSSPHRGEAVKINITSRPYKKQKHKLSINMGTIINQGKDIQIKINNKKFKMFAVENFIFPFDKNEAEIIKRMRRGRTLKVTAYNENGKKIEDSYSLRGVVKIISIINKACRK